MQRTEDAVRERVEGAALSHLDLVAAATAPLAASAAPAALAPVGGLVGVAEEF